MRLSFSHQPRPDYVLLALVGFVTLIGLIALTSASGIVAYSKFGDSLFYVKRQVLYGLCPGLVLLCIGMTVPYHFWRRWALPFFLFTMLLLVLVLIPGVGASYGRARSWFNVGGISFQPSELAKLSFLLYLAAWLERRSASLASLREGLLPFLILLGCVAGLIAFQPDVGTMGLIVSMAIAVYFVAGAPLWHLGMVVGGVMTAGAGLIAIAPYRLARLLTFLSPDADPSGAGYQLAQALLAIGSGGIFGRGLGASRQKFQYLPEVAGDSIIAIIGEELGFVALTLLLLIFFAILWRGFRIARRAPDRFSQLVVVGVCSWIIVQAFFNIGSMIGILPLTGLPLTFVSYGGTALAMIFFAVGIVLNISKHITPES